VKLLNRIPKANAAEAENAAPKGWVAQDVNAAKIV